MNRKKENISKTSNEISGEKTAPKEKNARKSASSASTHKFRAHSGIKFNFNVKKSGAIQHFNFETRSRDEKVNLPTCATRKTEIQTTKKENDASERVQTSMESLKISEEFGKVEKETQSFHDTKLTEKSVTLQQYESSDVVQRPHSISHLPQLSKIVKSELPKTLEDKSKSHELRNSKNSSLIAVRTQKVLDDARTERGPAEIFQQQPQDVAKILPPSASKIRPPSVAKAQTLCVAKSELPKFKPQKAQPQNVTKAQPQNVAKVQTMEDEDKASNAPTVPQKKYGFHTGLKLPVKWKKETTVKPFSFDSARKSSSSRNTGESK